MYRGTTVNLKTHKPGGDLLRCCQRSIQTKGTCDPPSLPACRHCPSQAMWWAPCERCLQHSLTADVCLCTICTHVKADSLPRPSTSGTGARGWAWLWVLWARRWLNQTHVLPGLLCNSCSQIEGIASVCLVNDVACSNERSSGINDPPAGYWRFSLPVSVVKPCWA